MTLELLHISDLHFAPALVNPPPALVKHHDMFALKALAKYCRQHPPDHLIATGDLATDGQVDSLTNAHTFIFGTRAVPTTVAGIAGGEIGLGFTDAQVDLVAGNHDRYRAGWLPFMGSSQNFETVFKGFLSPGHPRRTSWIAAHGLRLRVLSIDSCGGAGGLSIAKGRVKADDLRWLQDVYRADVDAGECWDLRLLLLHHHVALPHNRQFRKFKRLKNRNHLLAAMLRADIDLVCFGHEHDHYARLRTYRDLITKKRIRGGLVDHGYNLSKTLAARM